MEEGMRAHSIVKRSGRVERWRLGCFFSSTLLYREVFVRIPVSRRMVKSLCCAARLGVIMIYARQSMSQLGKIIRTEDWGMSTID